jgi:hypothetical protein
MRSFLAVFAVGLVALVAVSLTQQTGLVYSLGVNPARHAVTLEPGARACQGPVRVPSGAAFDRVGLFPDPVDGRPGPPVGVEVREAGSGRRLASGELPGGYRPFDARHPQVAEVGQVRTDAPLELCLLGRERPVAVVGQVGIASPTTSATLDGKAIATDMTLDVRRADRPLAAALPDIAERAARFRAGWVSPVVYLVLALAILVGAPLLLGRGLARAADEDQRSAASTARQ